MLNFDTVQSIFTKDEPRTPAVTNAMDENNEQQAEEQEEENQTASGETSEQESGQTQESQTQVEQQAGAGQQQVNQASRNKKYYIVAGSFKKRENAVNFRQELQDQGYNSEMIGERNGMHAVSYASFNNKSQAQRELQRLRNEEGVQAWLLYY